MSYGKGAVSLKVLDHLEVLVSRNPELVLHGYDTKGWLCRPMGMWLVKGNVASDGTASASCSIDVLWS